MNPLERLLFWRKFVIAGGKPTILEWRSLSEEDQDILAEAGRLQSLETIAAKSLAEKDFDFYQTLYQGAESLAGVEEEMALRSMLLRAKALKNETEKDTA